MMPATHAENPLTQYANILVPTALIPESFAASKLLPQAYICLPIFVLDKMNASISPYIKVINTLYGIPPGRRPPPI